MRPALLRAIVLVMLGSIRAGAAWADLASCWLDHSGRQSLGYGRVILERVDMKEANDKQLAQFAETVLRDQLRAQQKDDWLQLQVVNCWLAALPAQSLFNSNDFNDRDFVRRSSRNRVQLVLWGGKDIGNEWEFSYALVPILEASPEFGTVSYKGAADGRNPADKQLEAALRRTPTPMFAILAASAAMLADLSLSEPPIPTYDAARGICWPDVTITLLSMVDEELQRQRKALSETDFRHLSQKIAAYRKEASQLAAKTGQCTSASISAALHE